MKTKLLAVVTMLHAQLLTFRAHDQIDSLDDVDERFIFLVLNVRSTPADSTRCLRRNF